MLTADRPFGFLVVLLLLRIPKERPPLFQILWVVFSSGNSAENSDIINNDDDDDDDGKR